MSAATAAAIAIGAAAGVASGIASGGRFSGSVLLACAVGSVLGASLYLGLTWRRWR